MFEGKSDIEKVLNALSEQLEEIGSKNIEIVVCGGAALNVVGYIKRPTKDVDLVAFVDKSEKGLAVLCKATPMDPALLEAAGKVKNDFNLNEHWINGGPTSVVDFGLPKGLMDRVETHIYGKKLTVHFLGRYDQIHFKLYATIDQGGGKHYDDLLALSPTHEEIEAAAKWTMTHDVSEGYKMVLVDFLNKTGFSDVAKKL